MKKVFYLGALMLWSICGNTQTMLDTIGNTPVRIRIVADSTTVTAPWDLFWAPDQSLWCSDYNRLVRIDTATGQQHQLLKLDFGNVMGVAVHPDFPDTPWVYVIVDTTASYYAGGSEAELRRYIYSTSGDSLHSPQRILHWQHYGEHIGGRIVTGPDRKIYLTTSDYQDWYYRDTIGNCTGKILRVNPDGTIPPDNPRPDYTWSIEHRNPQGLVFTSKGSLISSELGNTNDELNLIRRNRNYGWPYYDGNDCTGEVQDTCNSSSYNYEHAMDIGVHPPSGIDYYESFAIPEFNYSIVESVLSGGGTIGGIIAYKLNNTHDGVIGKTSYLTGEYGRVRDVCMSPDGRLFFIAFDRMHADIRVIYNPDAHVGVENESEEMKLKIFPNPFSDIINFQKKSGAIGNWWIYDSNGKLMETGSTANSKLTVDLVNIASGIYLFRTENTVSRIVKN